MTNLAPLDLLSVDFSPEEANRYSTFAFVDDILTSLPKIKYFALSLCCDSLYEKLVPKSL